MQNTLKVTAKGQVTLKRAVLDHLGVSPGDKIIVDFLPSGRAEIRAANTGGSIDRFFGSMHQEGTVALTIDQINEFIADGYAGLRE